MTSTTSSPKDFFDDIFGKSVLISPNRSRFVDPTKYVLIGWVDLLIFPLIITGVLFVLSCFAWPFDKLNDYFVNVWPGNWSVLLFPPYWLSVPLMFVLALAVAACLLLRYIASAALFLIGLPFFFAYDAYVNSRPVTTTPQHTTRQAPGIFYSPLPQQIDYRYSDRGNDRSSAPPSYDSLFNRRPG